MQAPDRGGSSDGEKELERRVESLERQLERSLAENARLRKQLEEALRANKRSAAPFSKGEPKSDPKPPGRKPGAAYGQRTTRPFPSRVDEQIPVPLPPHWPHCHGPVISFQCRCPGGFRESERVAARGCDPALPGSPPASAQLWPPLPTIPWRYPPPTACAGTPRPSSGRNATHNPPAGCPPPRCPTPRLPSPGSSGTAAGARSDSGSAAGGAPASPEPALGRSSSAKSPAASLRPPRYRRDP